MLVCKGSLNKIARKQMVTNNITTPRWSPTCVLACLSLKSGDFAWCFDVIPRRQSSPHRDSKQVIQNATTTSGGLVVSRATCRKSHLSHVLAASPRPRPLHNLRYIPLHTNTCKGEVRVAYVRSQDCDMALVGCFCVVFSADQWAMVAVKHSFVMRGYLLAGLVGPTLLNLQHSLSAKVQKWMSKVNLIWTKHQTAVHQKAVCDACQQLSVHENESEPVGWIYH